MGLKPSPLANNYTKTPVEQQKYPLDLMQCESCSHVQLGQVVDPEILYSDYRYKSGVSRSFTAHLKKMAEDLSRLIPYGGAVIEIASNDGTLCKAFDDLGYYAWGVDPAASGDYFFRKAFFSEEVAVKLLHDIGSPDLIVANNVLAHVDDLRGVIRGVKKLLKHNGLFVFEVQYLVDLIEQQRFDLIYHEHLDYHHLAPLKPFLASEGLMVVNVERNTSQGGSIRVFCRHANGDEGFPMDDAVNITRLTIPENPVKDVDGVVAAYGACAKTTGLICQTGAKFDVLYDDTPEKHLLYAPTGQLIVTPEEIKADHVYIAAWNFEKEIKARHPELRYVC